LIASNIAIMNIPNVKKDRTNVIHRILAEISLLLA